MRNAPIPSPPTHAHTLTGTCSPERERRLSAVNQHIAEILMKQEPKQVGGGRNAELDVHLSSSNTEAKLVRNVKRRAAYHLQKYFLRKIELTISYTELE